MSESKEGAEEDRGRLSEKDEEDVQKNRSLSPVSVYAVVHEEGREELDRPLLSLWWSGVAAGIGISASVLAEGTLHAVLGDGAAAVAVADLGYTIGFVLVILGRLQLFTENTITAILPLLSRPSARMVWCTARLWGIVLVANLVGTFCSAALSTWVGVVPPEHIAGMLAISRDFAALEPYQAFARGIPAGFFVAAIVWMLPSARAASIFVIIMFTYLIAIGGFTHVIAGSTELFLLALSGDATIGHSAALIGATLVGNIAGGTGLFALLAYGQVVNELPS
ncbi:formate/nitrite transporter family protein [Pararhizobium mangrovi]|uniref:Formate/nitrite transporter family protein n=1 Tax=Pararhizobium mangrovi TaxID=2590452 RepID=A0A506U798_9HYPH|nr:formate/nitrite transporter family protein [Pararhizobium mangrovi]TPW30243.1 formate/nitrite transporter family protein [Pararhizobium mangrovi]